MVDYVILWGAVLTLHVLAPPLRLARQLRLSLITINNTNYTYSTVKGSIKCYLQYQLALIKWNNECWMEFCVFAEKISVLSYWVLQKNAKNYREVDFTYWNPGNVDIVTGFRSLKSSLWFCMKEYWMKRSLNPYEFLGHGSFYRLFLPWTQKFVI